MLYQAQGPPPLRPNYKIPTRPQSKKSNNSSNRNNNKNNNRLLQNSRSTNNRFTTWTEQCSVASTPYKPSMNSSCGATLFPFSSASSNNNDKNNYSLYYSQRVGNGIYIARPMNVLFRYSARQRLALRCTVPINSNNNSLKEDCASDHPLRKLREIGASLISNNIVESEEGVSNFTSLLEEIVIPNSYTVRLNDVEARIMHVHGENVMKSPIKSHISQYSIYDGCSFLLKPLHDIHNNNNNNNNIPRWKKYITAVSLYISLADAGFCDSSLPFLSIKWINWRELLQNQMHLKLDLMSNTSTRSMLNPNLNKNKDDKIPVALILPITMKGKLHRLYNENSSISISTQPFSDAEIFQLFYLQLIFRALYDIRFPGMMSEDGYSFIRSDLIASQSSGRQPLAFQHPNKINQWILFPARSKILQFINLEEAIIPYYSSLQECENTKHQKLFGATPLLPCQGNLGRKVIIEWAMKRIINSPNDAYIALEELFNFFMNNFGVTRKEIWHSPIAPRIYRCGNVSFTRLQKNNSDLLNFLAIPSSFVPESQEVEIQEEKKEEEQIEKQHKIHDDANEENLTIRWRKYIKDGNINLFESSTDNINIITFLGSGGSSLVYKGLYGPKRIPVAVKCLIIPDGMEYEDYVKESLTNLAFLILFNQMENYGIVQGPRVYDFIISSKPPKGMPEEDIRTCCREVNSNLSIKLCYLVSALMDGVIGKFLTEEDEDFDPCYDVLINSPLRDGEVFQFIYTQLALRALFDYTIMDMMLNGQLRGDNLGYRYVSRINSSNEEKQSEIPSYNGIYIIYQANPNTAPRYLLFPANMNNNNNNEKIDLLRFICFIDLGQGKQPALQELSKRGLIGETIVDSCIQDDGLGRYWPPDKIYSKYIETKGNVAKSAITWGAEICINSPQDAVNAIEELFNIFFPIYGVEASLAKTREEMELDGYAVFAWTPENIEELQRQYVYREA